MHEKCLKYATLYNKKIVVFSFFFFFISKSYTIGKISTVDGQLFNV